MKAHAGVTAEVVRHLYNDWVKPGSDIDIDACGKSMMKRKWDPLLKDAVFEKHLQDVIRAEIRKIPPPLNVIKDVEEKAQMAFDFTQEGFEIQAYYEPEPEKLVAVNIENMEPAEVEAEAVRIEKKIQQKTYKDRKHVAELRAREKALVEKSWKEQEQLLFPPVVEGPPNEQPML